MLVFPKEQISQESVSCSQHLATNVSAVAPVKNNQLTDEAYHRPFLVKRGMNTVELFKQFHCSIFNLQFSILSVSESCLFEVFYIIGLYAPTTV